MKQSHANNLKDASLGPRIQYDPGVSIPASFPRKTPGAVPGAQPKFLATLTNNRYVGVTTDKAVRIRYLICTDYVKRIVGHLQTKLLEVSIPLRMILSNACFGTFNSKVSAHRKVFG